MCTREELNNLIRELLKHIEKVAVLSAQIQYDEELKSKKPVEYLTCSDKTNNAMRDSSNNARLNQLVRFHVAYLRYFVFSIDRFTEIIIPLSPSSLSLFMTNIVSDFLPQPIIQHTSRTILEFLQVCFMKYPRFFQCTSVINFLSHSHSQAINSDLVRTLCNKFKNALANIIKELHMPHDINALTKIRHECFRQNMQTSGNQLKLQDPVFKQPEMPTRNLRSRKVKMPAAQPTVRTRTAAYRTRSTKRSATITQETTVVELEGPRLLQYPPADCQYASYLSDSPASSYSSPGLFIASPVSTPDYQTIGEPITMTTTTMSETDVVYQFEELNMGSTPCYVISSDEPITVGEFVPEAGSQTLFDGNIEELTDVSAGNFHLFFFTVTNTILHCFFLCIAEFLCFTIL